MEIPGDIPCLGCLSLLSLPNLEDRHPSFRYCRDVKRRVVRFTSTYLHYWLIGVHLTPTICLIGIVKHKIFACICHIMLVISMNVYVCIYIYVYICIYIYICMCVYIYVFIQCGALQLPVGLLNPINYSP